MTRFLAVTPYNGYREKIINVSYIVEISPYTVYESGINKGEISEIIFDSGKRLLVKEKYDSLRFVLVATEDLRALAK